MSAIWRVVCVGLLLSTVTNLQASVPCGPGVVAKSGFFTRNFGWLVSISPARPSVDAVATSSVIDVKHNVNQLPVQVKLWSELEPISSGKGVGWRIEFDPQVANTVLNATLGAIVGAAPQHAPAGETLFSGPFGLGEQYLREFQSLAPNLAEGRIALTPVGEFDYRKVYVRLFVEKVRGGRLSLTAYLQPQSQVDWLNVPFAFKQAVAISTPFRRDFDLDRREPDFFGWLGKFLGELGVDPDSVATSTASIRSEAQRRAKATAVRDLWDSGMLAHVLLRDGIGYELGRALKGAGVTPVAGMRRRAIVETYSVKPTSLSELIAVVNSFEGGIFEKRAIRKRATQLFAGVAGQTRAVGISLDIFVRLNEHVGVRIQPSWKDPKNFLAVTFAADGTLSNPEFGSPERVRLEFYGLSEDANQIDVDSLWSFAWRKR